MTIHLAARETFAVDGIPACKGRRGFLSETDGGFDATHTLTDVTCGNCQRTAEFKRAKRLGLKDNDQTWDGYVAPEDRRTITAGESGMSRIADDRER